MLTLSHTAALLLGAGALAAGVLAGFAGLHLRTRAGYVPLAAHRDETAALRRRYRRRLRALRDAALRHRVNEEQLRRQLQVAEARHAEQARERDEAEAALRAAQDRVAALERDEGLMRIERDELVARTQRLRALPSPPALEAVAAGGDDARPAEAGGPSRAELAERNARIHDLECRLRESAARVNELEASLHTWKYRIAPLALHMKQQRDRAPPAAPRNARPPAARDDLKRIRGIGRALERKMNAAGIRHFDQLARMSPAEVASLAGRIGVAATRPVREHWVEQAQAMVAPAAGATAG